MSKFFVVVDLPDVEGSYMGAPVVFGPYMFAEEAEAWASDDRYVLVELPDEILKATDTRTVVHQPTRVLKSYVV